MRIRTNVRPARAFLMTSISALLLVGPIGCGSDTPPTGSSSALPPEAKQANSNMEDFMKNQQKK